MDYNKKMYSSSKTQQFDQQNFNPNFYLESPTLNQGILINDQALSRAIQIIQQLKENLAFALKINEKLSSQNQILKVNSERVTKKINSDAMIWQKKLKQIECQKKQYAQLLEQTKLTLYSLQQECNQRKKQIDKLEKIIYEQKKAYEQLQLNYMNQSVSYVGDTSSLNIGKTELNYINELQKQNHELQLQIKRLTQQMEKNETKIAKQQKENNQFKKWMATVLGLQKVVEGTENLLMKQIAKRILPM